MQVLRLPIYKFKIQYLNPVAHSITETASIVEDAVGLVSFASALLQGMSESSLAPPPAIEREKGNGATRRVRSQKIIGYLNGRLE